MKKLKLLNLKQEWADIFKFMDKKELKITEEEVQKEVVAARKANR